MPAPYLHIINSVVTQKNQERVVDHRCFGREINLEKTTDYTPTMVTISGKIKGVYVSGYHPDTPGIGALIPFILPIAYPALSDYFLSMEVATRDYPL